MPVHTEISRDDLVTSIADGLQYISCFHPPEFVRYLSRAYEREQSVAAKDAIGQILRNSRLSAFAHRPICQDTGIVNIFLKIGMQVRWTGLSDLGEAIDEAVTRAYADSGNPLRASVVRDPLFSRRNTGTNAPAVVHTEIVAGGSVDIHVAAKGGGSENKARFAVLNPGESVSDWVVARVSELGAGWCPPGVLGIGVGGTAEKAMLLAKEALFEPLDMEDLLARGAATPLEQMRVDLFKRVNALGIGAQGLGGITTALDVKIRQFPTHAASMPVALIPNCAANRHVHFRLDGSGPASLPAPRLDDWPAAVFDAGTALRKVDLNGLTGEEVRSWRAGERLLLNGRLLTARDAAHRRIAQILASSGHLPAELDFAGRTLYYVGPAPAAPGEIIGSAGPTTAARMDAYTEMMLGTAGVLVTIGKGERGPAAIDAIRRHGGAYLIAVGGAGYLLSQSIRRARTVAFADLGMEAVYELDVTEMPVTVAIDSLGQSIHERGPAEWRQRISEIGVAHRQRAREPSGDSR